MTPSISINIITYGIPEFMSHMLASLFKAGVPKDVPVRLYEDRQMDHKTAKDVSNQYRQLCAHYGVEYFQTPVWGCCQGTAQYAAMNSHEDWLVMLGDDILIKKGAPQSWVDRIRAKYDRSSAGLVGLSWWEADVLQGAGHIKAKKDILAPGFLEAIPDNPMWEKPEILYINVHGSGFLMRRKMWEQVGGFSQNTWCWDEDISFRCWMFSCYNIFTAPGPSIIHYCAQASGSIGKTEKSLLTNPRNIAVHQTFGNGAPWERSWGYNKAVTSKLLYMIMNEARKKGTTIDVVGLRNKPMADKISDWEAAAAQYEKLTGVWFMNNDAETLGV